LNFSVLGLYATPDPFGRITAHILGATENDYTVLEYEFLNHGTHWEYFEKYSKVKYNLSNNEEIERILISHRKISIDPSTFEKTETNIEEPNFDASFQLIDQTIVQNSEHNLNDIYIDNGIIEIFQKYRDAPGGYKASIPVPFLHSENDTADVIEVLITETHYLFKIEHTDWDLQYTAARFFAISKDAYEELIIHSL
jgi:hypothetical protein